MTGDHFGPLFLLRGNRMARSRQSILADEERFEHKVEMVKQDRKEQTLPESTSFLLNGKKILKKEVKNNKTYTSLIGRTDLNPDLYRNLKTKGMIN